MTYQNEVLTELHAIANKGHVITTTITRPNTSTPYNALDVIGGATDVTTTFDTTLNKGDMFTVLGSRLYFNGSTVPTGCTGFKLHLYNAAPTPVGDNAAFDLPLADRPKYLGSITISTPVVLGTTVYAQDDEINFTVKLAADSSTIYAVLQSVGAYTPAPTTAITVNLNIAEL